MSYQPPNKLKPALRQKLTLRRAWEMWPLLVWLAVLFLALVTYQSGVKFRRMNGAVDVYQVSISPPEDSKFKTLGPGIARGLRVKTGDVIAVMESTEVDEKIKAIEDELRADHLDEMRSVTGDIAKIDASIAELQLKMAGARAERDALREFLDSKILPLTKGGKKYEQALQEIASLQPDLAKINATVRKLDAEVGVDSEKGAYQIAIDTFEASKAIPLQARQDLEATKTDPREYARRFNKKNDLAALDVLEKRLQKLTLLAPHSGVVDRIEKEPGEFVKAGEAIVRIVGDPEYVLCFLPQEEIGRLAPGDKIWITPTFERKISWESTVISLAPRMNSLADSTSPLPNRRMFGRDVVIAYPDVCKDLSDPENPKFKLLPGQTLTIHLEEPGSVPLFEQIFHNDTK